MSQDLFNSRGELSSDGFKDAIAKVVKYASIIDEMQSSNTAFSSESSFSESQRDEMLRQAVDSHEGKVALGQAMALPIRRNLDYMGVGRKAVVPDPLAQGVLPVYDRDIDVGAVVISSNGSAPESRVFGDRVSVPDFTIVSNPTIKYQEVKRRRFNVIDRAQQKARQEISAQEDQAIFTALDFAADSTKGGENTVQTLDNGTTTDELAKVGLLNLKRQVDHWDNFTAKYFMNINQYIDILNWESAGAAGSSQIDPVTHRELIQTGLVATFFGTDIIVSKIVPPKQVFACAEPEFVGVMPIISDVECVPADEPKQLKLGFVISEQVGVGILNPRGVATGFTTS